MALLTATEIRELAEKLALRPSKGLGQNFVIDGNVCQRIVRQVTLNPNDVVLEIGPGLGSLTLAILESSVPVVAIEIDERLSKQLPETILSHMPNAKFLVMNKDAMHLDTADFSEDFPFTKQQDIPTVLIANLPYNVSVPVLLNLLEKLPSLREGVVMVQAEVADRLAAEPSTKEFGVPSLKCAWWAELKLTGNISRTIFWPIPNVDSKLVYFKRHEPLGSDTQRKLVFALIDAAFSQRRKMIRSSLSKVLGSTASTIISNAGIEPTLRGESLTINQYLKIALESNRAL